MFEFIKNSVEVQGWGLNNLTISSLLTAIFTVLQAIGINSQSRKIWKEENADSVSWPLFVYSFAYFFSFLLYAIEKNSLAMLFNALLGFFYIPIILGIKKFKPLKTWEKYFSFCIPTMFILMACVTSEIKDVLLLLYLAGCLIGTVMQFLEVYQNKSRGNLSLKFLVIFFATNVFWLGYAIVIDSWVFQIFNSVCMFLFIFGFYFYFKYPPPPVIKRR